MTSTVKKLYHLRRLLREVIEDIHDDPYVSADDIAELNTMWDSLVRIRNMVRDRQTDDKPE